MPAVSGSQYRLMQAALHGNSKKVSKKVARNFVNETPPDKRKMFAKGGKR